MQEPAIWSIAGFVVELPAVWGLPLDVGREFDVVLALTTSFGLSFSESAFHAALGWAG